MRVRNLAGTAGRTCSCPGGWLGHWVKFNPDKQPLPGRCCVNGCRGPAEVGGHVTKVDSVGRDTYIIPICDACNKSDGILTIYDGTSLAPAAKDKTCEKPVPPKRGFLDALADGLPVDFAKVARSK